MKLFSRLCAVMLLLLMSACSYQDMVDKLVPKPESQFAQNFLERLRNRDFVYVRGVLDASVTGEATEDKLKQIADFFPGGARVSAELIGSQVNVVNGQWWGNFTYEYRFAGGWCVANAVLKKSGDTLSVAAFNVTRTSASQRELNRFTLQGRSALHYTVLTWAVLAAVFSLVTAVVCLRTPIPKRRWLWVLAVLAGVGSFNLNWTTGQWGFQLLQLRLLSVGTFAAGPSAPWVLSVSLPLWAILFWVKRGAWVRGGSVEAEAVAQAPKLDADS